MTHLETLRAQVADDVYDVQDLYWTDGKQHQKNVTKKIPTSIAIRAYPAWQGVYPFTRELVQNAIDHLHLLDSSGFLADTVRFTYSETFDCQYLCFHVEEEQVLTFEVENDRLRIKQAFTVPLTPDTLDDGVCDPRKINHTSAGGFGVGFKDAARSILQQDGSMVWTMYDAAGHRIKWEFARDKHPKRSGRLASGATAVSTMCVQVGASKLSSSSHNNVLIQEVHFKDIGPQFFAEALPKMSLFWSQNGLTRVRAREGLHDFLAADVPLHACLANNPRIPISRAEKGVYVRGLWVQSMSSALRNAIVFFGAQSANVSSRDRNSVNWFEIVNGVRNILVDTRDPDVAKRALAYLHINSKDTSSFLAASESFWISVFPNRAPLYSLLSFPEDVYFVKPPAKPSPKNEWARKSLGDMGASLVQVRDEAIHHGLFKITPEDVLFKAAIERHAKLTVACEDEDSPWHTMLHAISTMREREEDCIVIHDTSAPFFLHDTKNAIYIIAPDAALTKSRLRIMTLCLLKDDDSHCGKIFDALERLGAKDKDAPLTKQDFQDALRVASHDTSDDSSSECSEVSHDSIDVDDSEDPPSPSPRFYSRPSAVEMPIPVRTPPPVTGVPVAPPPSNANEAPMPPSVVDFLCKIADASKELIRSRAEESDFDDAVRRVRARTG